MALSFSFKKKLGFNTLFFICLGLLMIVVISFSQDFLKIREINKEVRQLEYKIVELQDYNSELKELLKYFNSDSYAEQKARTELGLKKPGEEVVIIPQNNAIEITQENLSEVVPKNPSNTLSWLDFILKGKK